MSGEMVGRTRAARWGRHPARLITVGFGLAILVGAALLMLPVATETGVSADPLTAVFTSTSAVCLTGLVVVDTSGHWSTFGEVVVRLVMLV